MIYFDNAATTFPKPNAVYEAIDFTNRNLAVNAGRGSYKLAHKANSLINQARIDIARLSGTKADDVIFMPSNTFAMNSIICGLNWDRAKKVYVTPFEHNAVMRPLNLCAKQYGCKINVMPFSQEDFSLKEAELDRMFANENPDYIFINHASNVVGNVCPIGAISKLAKQYNAIIVLDVAQTFGVVDIKKTAPLVDFIVFAGHKNLFGPFGVGGFINISGIKLNTVFAGGTGSDSLNLEMPKDMPLQYEIGSPNLPAITGLSAGIKWVEDVGLETIANHKSKLIKKLVSGLSKLDKVNLFLPNEKDYLTGVLSFSVKGYEAHDVGMILNDEFDIAVRTGYHCAPLVHSLIGSEKNGGTVRVSVSYFNTIDEVDKLIEAIGSL